MACQSRDPARPEAGEAFFPCHVKCPERSEPLGFGHLRVFLIFPFIYAAFRAFALSTGIGQVKGKHSKSEREMKKLYDLNPFVQFEWFANPHVRCNNHVLSVQVSGFLGGV